MRKWWALAAALTGAILLAVLATTPPGPSGADAPATTFSAARAMNDVRAIARAPHPTGSEENAKVRAYLVARLKSMGLATETTTSPMSADGLASLNKQRQAEGPAPQVVNIIATLPGTDPSQPAVLLMAHHDSVWGSPGAADDGAGVASVLETVRAVKAAGPQRRDLMVLLTDGEELGLLGAKAFFAGEPRRARVGVIVNLETRGGGGRASMFETGDGNGAMVGLFGQAVRRPVGTSLSVFIYNHLPNFTDYTIAKKLGIPGFNFAFIGRSGLYHSPLSIPETLDQGAVQDMGRQTLDLTRALTAAPELPGKAPDRTFFDAFGLFFISYAPALGWLFLIVAAGGYAASAWRRAGVVDVARGAAAMLALAAVAGALLYLVNLVSGADGAVNYYDRLAAIPRLETQALLLCVAGLVAVWGVTAAWCKSEAGIVPGAAVLLLALGAFVQWAAPTASYPIVVPLMLGALAAAAGRFTPEPAGKVAQVAAAMLGVGYMLGFGFFLLQAVGPGMPMVAALPTAIAALLLAPLMPAVPRGRALQGAGVLVVLALAIALWVRLDAVAPSAAVYSVFK